MATRANFLPPSAVSIGITASIGLNAILIWGFQFPSSPQSEIVRLFVIHQALYHPNQCLFILSHDDPFSLHF